MQSGIILNVSLAAQVDQVFGKMSVLDAEFVQGNGKVFEMSVALRLASRCPTARENADHHRREYSDNSQDGEQLHKSKATMHAWNNCNTATGSQTCGSKTRLRTTMPLRPVVISTRREAPQRTILPKLLREFNLCFHDTPVIRRKLLRMPDV
jgi:hypothetical protein